MIVVTSTVSRLLVNGFSATAEMAVGRRFRSLPFELTCLLPCQDFAYQFIRSFKGDANERASLCTIGNSWVYVEIQSVLPARTSLCQTALLIRAGPISNDGIVVRYLMFNVAYLSLVCWFPRDIQRCKVAVFYVSSER